MGILSHVPKLVVKSEPGEPMTLFYYANISGNISCNYFGNAWAVTISTSLICICQVLAS